MKQLNEKWRLSEAPARALEKGIARFAWQNAVSKSSAWDAGGTIEETAQKKSVRWAARAFH